MALFDTSCHGALAGGWPRDHRGRRHPDRGRALSPITRPRGLRLPPGRPCWTLRDAKAGYLTPLTNSATSMSSARAMRVIVRRRGSRSARSRSEISVLCKPHLNPSSSCEVPACLRARLRLEANCWRGSTPVIVCESGQKLYRQNTCIFKLPSPASGESAHRWLGRKHSLVRREEVPSVPVHSIYSSCRDGCFSDCWRPSPARSL